MGIAFISLVYPALVLTYSGEAAYLIKHPENIGTAFYSSVPSLIYWPVFIIATLTPHLCKLLHHQTVNGTGLLTKSGHHPHIDQYEGRVYFPQLNYILVVLFLATVAGFKGGAEISNAYGVAVIWVMLITTCLMTVVCLSYGTQTYCLFLSSYQCSSQ